MRVTLTKESMLLLLIGSICIIVGFSIWNSYLVGLGLVLCFIPVTGLVFLRKSKVSIQGSSKELILDYGSNQEVHVQVNGSINPCVIVLKHNKKWNKEQKYVISETPGDSACKNLTLKCYIQPYEPGVNSDFIFKIKEKDPLNLLTITTTIKPELTLYSKIPVLDVSEHDIVMLEKNMKCHEETSLDDFYLKEWQSGEGYDRVNWKLTAKTGKKIVKIQEKPHDTVELTLSPSFNGVKEFNILREKVLRCLQNYETVSVNLSDTTCTVTRDSTNEFELFLSKNLINKENNG